jgi:ACR3 family arsenite efflux pump ArsB
MLLGLLVGALVDVRSLSEWVLPLTILMVYPMLIGFKPREALATTDAKPVGLAMGLNFLVLPLVAWGLAWLFFRDQPSLYVGMILTGLFPTSGMTISWTGFAKGNVRAAVQMTVIGLVLASLLAPVYLLVLAGRVVPIDPLNVLTMILLIVGLPMLAGSLTRIAFVRARGQAELKRLQPAFQGVSTLGVLAIVFVAIALKARMILTQPALLAWVLVPVVLFYIINYALAIGVGRRLRARGDAVAVVYGTVMRNLSIALGLAVASFGAEAALVLAAAFIVQVQSAAWSVRAFERGELAKT